MPLRAIRCAVPLAAAAMALLFQVACMDLRSVATEGDRLASGDSYTWQALIHAWQETNRWSPAVAAHNAPDGLKTHLTLPYAALVAGLARVVKPLLPDADATRLAGRLSGPVLHAAAAAVLAWGIVPLLGPGGALTSVLAFLSIAGLSARFHVQVFDHHALHVAMECLVLALLCRYAVRGRCRSAASAGLAAGLGLWTGTEMLIPAGIGGLALGINWVVFGGGRRAWGLAGYALGMAVAIAVALCIERPLAELAALDLDRLSGSHGLMGVVAAAAAGAAAWAQQRWPAAGVARRLAAAAGTTATGALLMWAVVPDFLRGPYGSVTDAVVKDHWRGLLGDHGAAAWFAAAPDMLGYHLALAGLAATGTAVGLGGREREAWTVVAIGLLVGALGAFVQLRLSVHYGTFASVALGGTVAAAGRWVWVRASWITRPAAIPVALGVLVWPYIGLLVGARFGDDSLHPSRANAWRDPDCDWMAVGKALQRQKTHLPGGTVVSYAPPGPELAHFSGRGVVATGCHCNPAGMRDALAILLSESEAAKRVAVRRRVAFVVQCPSIRGWQGHDWYLARSGTRGIYARLARGEPPPWLVRVPLAGFGTEAFIVHRTTFGTVAGRETAGPAP